MSLSKKSISESNLSEPLMEKGDPDKENFLKDDNENEEQNEPEKDENPDAEDQNLIFNLWRTQNSGIHLDSSEHIWKLGKIDNSSSIHSEIDKRKIDSHNKIPKENIITALALNNDGNLAYCGTSYGEVHVVNIEKYDSSQFPNQNSSNPHSRTLSISSSPGDTQQVIKYITAKRYKLGKINDMVLTNNEKYLYCGTSKRVLFRINVNNKEWEIEIVDTKNYKDITKLVISNDDQYLLSASDDSTVRLYNLNEIKDDKPTEIKENLEKIDNKDQHSADDGKKYINLSNMVFIGFTLDVKSVAFTKDNSKFLSGSLDGYIKIWNIENNSLPISTHTSTTGQITKMILTDKDTFLIFGTSEGYVSVWLFKTMTEYHNFYAHSSHVASLLSISDSGFVISTSNDNKIKILNLKDKFEERSFFFYNNNTQQNGKKKETNASINLIPINTIQISKDSSFLLIASKDQLKRFTIYQVPTQNTIQGVGTYLPEKHKHLLRGHTSGISVLLYSSKINRLISGSGDATIIIWNNNMIEKQLKGHSQRVRCFAIIEKEKESILFSGSHDRTIMIWNLYGDYKGELFGNHSEYVWCLSLYNNNKSLASGSSDKSICLWEISTKRKFFQIDQAHNLPITTLTMVENSMKCLTTSLDGKLIIWDFNACEEPENKKVIQNINKESKSKYIFKIIKLYTYPKKEKKKVKNIQRDIEINNKKDKKNPEPQCCEMTKHQSKFIVGCRDSTIFIFFNVNSMINSNETDEPLMILGTLVGLEECGSLN